MTLSFQKTLGSWALFARRDRAWLQTVSANRADTPQDVRQWRAALRELLFHDASHRLPFARRLACSDKLTRGDGRRGGAAEGQLHQQTRGAAEGRKRKVTQRGHGRKRLSQQEWHGWRGTQRVALSSLQITSDTRYKGAMQSHTEAQKYRQMAIGNADDT